MTVKTCIQEQPFCVYEGNSLQCNQGRCHRICHFCSILFVVFRFEFCTYLIKHTHIVQKFTQTYIPHSFFISILFARIFRLRIIQFLRTLLRYYLASTHVFVAHLTAAACFAMFITENRMTHISRFFQKVCFLFKILTLFG